MLILASASPRRRQLLRGLGLAFDVRPQNCEEMSSAALPQDYVTQIALQKARSALKGAGEEDVVLAADTVVCLENTILGKPGTLAQARQMLEMLSGRTHKVHTGVCICRGARAAATVETTMVQFSPIAEEDLLAYVRTPEPYDKAGAYAIQGHAALWCAGIAGCYYNIMGLPVHRTAQLLRRFG